MGASAASRLSEGPYPYDWGDEPPVMDRQQELVLAQTIAAGRSAAPGLRHAVIPLESISSLPIAGAIALVTARSQDRLLRATREWARRGGQPEVLIACLDRLAGSLRAAGHVALADEAAVLTAVNTADLLKGALRLDRRLVGEPHKLKATADFSAELERQLAVLEKAYPASFLERADIESAQAIVREYFIRAHMPMVRRRAGRVRRWSRLSHADIIQSGNEGLIQAVDKYDPRFGAPFAAYGHTWIKQAISRAERLVDLIPLPHQLHAARPGIRRAIDRAAAEGAAPDIAAIAAGAKLEPHMVNAVLSADERTVSLDGEEEGLLEKCADERAPTGEHKVMDRERREAVARAVARSGRREREIISRYYGIGCPAQPILQIAAELGLTHQRIYQLKEIELRRLRRPAVAKELVQHL